MLEERRKSLKFINRDSERSLLNVIRRSTFSELKKILPREDKKDLSPFYHKNNFDDKMDLRKAFLFSCDVTLLDI